MVRLLGWYGASDLGALLDELKSDVQVGYGKDYRLKVLVLSPLQLSALLVSQGSLPDQVTLFPPKLGQDHFT